MYVDNNPFSKNLARLLGHKEHYERNEEFQDNLDLIEAKLGIGRTTIYRWINGKGFTSDKVKKVCELFNWNFYELFIDYDKQISCQNLSAEYREIIRMLVTVTDKDILDAIMSSIKMGLAVNGKIKFK